MVLHNLDQLDQSNEDTVRLLQRAVAVQDWTLCRELIRFLHSLSVDDRKGTFKQALGLAGILALEQEGEMPKVEGLSLS